MTIKSKYMTYTVELTNQFSGLMIGVSFTEPAKMTIRTARAVDREEYTSTYSLVAVPTLAYDGRGPPPSDHTH